MIKTIKKIDLQGQEYLQEVVVCDHHKQILEDSDFYYTFEITGWRPVKLRSGGYGLSNPKKWHICQSCFPKVVDLIEHTKPLSKAKIETLEEKCTDDLIAFRNSFLCGIQTAAEIDRILKARGKQV